MPKQKTSPRPAGRKAANDQLALPVDTAAPAAKADNKPQPAAKPDKAQPPAKAEKAPAVDKVHRAEVPEVMKDSIREYAAYVILQRALVSTDGLKPVARRILFGMYKMGLGQPSAKTRKSATIVGEVMGKYHPHGDASIYDAMARMAQDFSMPVPLVFGQGNFGSIDGDSPAAMRYTEAKLARSAADFMLRDVEEDTVPWGPNYDNTHQEPLALPVRFPVALVEGTTGIAEGFSSTVTPHNLVEVCQAVIYLCQKWAKRDKVTLNELMQFIKGPDFPTGGWAYRYRRIGDGDPVDVFKLMYETGQAKAEGFSGFMLQAVAELQEGNGGRKVILIKEIPYGITKTTLIEQLNGKNARSVLVDEYGLADVNDESDAENGLCIRLETRRGADAQALLNAVLDRTDLRRSMQYNATLLVDSVDEEGTISRMPERVGLKHILLAFVEFRLGVITRRSNFRLEKAKARLHLVEGLLLALDQIDRTIQLIRAAKDRPAAKASLIKNLKVSEIQAQAILEIQLQRLVGLDRAALAAEKKELAEQIKGLQRILKDEAVRLDVVIEETKEVAQVLGQPRRTRIVEDQLGHTTVSVGTHQVEGEQVLVIRTDGVDRVTAADYRDRTQAGALSGKAMPRQLARLTAGPDAPVVLISRSGRLWRGKVGAFAEESDLSGLKLDPKDFLVYGGAPDAEHPLLMLTRTGEVKRLKPDELDKRAEGTWGSCFSLAEGDEIVFAAASGEQDELFVLSAGLAGDARLLRFNVADVNPKGLGAGGMAGMKLDEGDALAAGAVIPTVQTAKAEVVIATAQGLVKRCAASEFPVAGRATKGLLVGKVTEKTGPAVGLAVVASKDALIDLHTPRGKRLRVTAADIRGAAREKNGSRLEALTDETLASVTLVLPLSGPEAKS
jgi:DNA gyrase subunit A